MEWRGLEVRHAPPVSAWHAGWIHQPAQRLYMIAGDASRLYSLDLPCLSPEKKARPPHRTTRNTRKTHTPPHTHTSRHMHTPSLMVGAAVR
jgi:hypothetical protein